MRRRYAHDVWNGKNVGWLTCHGFFLFLDCVLFLLHCEKGDFSILMKYIFLIL